MEKRKRYLLTVLWLAGMLLSVRGLMASDISLLAAMLVGAVVSGARLAAEKSENRRICPTWYLSGKPCVFRTHGVHAGTGNVTPGQSGDTALESSFRYESQAVSGGRQCMDKIRAYVGTSVGTAGFLCCCADPTEKAVGSVPAFHARTGSGKRTERQNDVAGSLCASACRGENLPIL